MISLNQINDLLEFYGINDIDYKHQCRLAYENLEALHLFEKFDELHHLLFLEGEHFLKFWYFPNVNAMFECEVHPFASNILLLSGGYYHQEIMKTLNFDDEQIEKHKMRVRGTLTNDLIVKGLPGIRVSQVIWGAYFIHGRLIECGGLQFEKAKANPFFGWKEDHIEIHIPMHTSFKKEDILASISQAKKDVEKYFNMKDVDFCCFSWLLSPQVNSYLDDSSNIKQFYKMFDVTEADDCEGDIRNHLFNDTLKVPYDKLPEHTSLQRKIKAALIEGVKFNRGKGTLVI